MAVIAAPTGAQAMGKGLSNKPGDNRWASMGGRRVLLASGIAEGAQILLERDFAAIEKLEFAQPDPELLRVLGIREASSVELTRWMSERMGYIVSADEELTPVYGGAAVYPYPDQLPEDGGSAGLAMPGTHGANGNVIMSNDGVDLYAAAKKRARRVSVVLPGAGALEIGSPRVGLFRIGPALFDPNYYYKRDHFVIAPDSRLASLKRITTLFHEARHSDGHGRSLGFSHGLCPRGHALQGAYACDRSANGAYAVGALVAGAVLESCKDCDAHERAVLSVLASDSWDRVLVEAGAAGAAYWDAEPETL